MAAVLRAAEAAHVDSFVRMLPDGYDTVIDEEGDNVSAGQKQLITIARAFLADPSLLILDEATSSVDTRTELLVQHAMAALRSDRTSFVIAHRLSTIRDADLILVMEAGRIVERRCAMTKLVRPARSEVIARWMSTSVRVSTEDVASSRIRIAGSARNARAMVISWRCPALTLPPSSSMTVS